MIIDKEKPNTTIGFEAGILYCFNNSLKGTLCNQCKSKADCEREENVLINAAREFQKLAGNKIEIQMKEVRDYSVDDLKSMIKYC